MVKPKPRTSGLSQANHSLNPDRATGGAGGANMRSKSTINRLLMYKGGKPVRDKTGRIVKAAAYQSKLPSGTVARVEPNRRWFGNTRVITQKALQTFQEEMGKVVKDPYKMVMQRTRLPITLLNETAKHSRVHLLDTQPYEATFGPKAQRKRPSVKAADMESLAQLAESRGSSYNAADDTNIPVIDDGTKAETRDVVFRAGQSKRLWNELYKVIDSSDVVVQVLDARDPMGTRSKYIEDYLRKDKAHKQLFFVLNKCDLVPTWVTQKWVAILSTEYPTLAFHASLTNSFGKGALIQLLRQFGKLHADKKQISVGFIGYPNVGKSSIINTLRAKKVCKVAPIAGETKVWQYVTLMRRIFLIDCPGVVYPTGDSETDIVLKSVVRVEYLKDPEDHVVEVLKRARSEYIRRTYGVDGWTDHENFLEQLAQRTGKLLKGGEPDIKTVAKMVLNDWQRGKIPYFVKPPGEKTEQSVGNLEQSQRKSSSATTAQAPEAVAAVSASPPAATDAPAVATDAPAAVADDVGTRASAEAGAAPLQPQQQKGRSSAAAREQPVLAVRQDFKSIAVAPEFFGDDVAPEEPLDDAGTLPGDEAAVDASSSGSEADQEEDVNGHAETAASAAATVTGDACSDAAATTTAAGMKIGRGAGRAAALRRSAGSSRSSSAAAVEPEGVVKTSSGVFTVVPQRTEAAPGAASHDKKKTPQSQRVDHARKRHRQKGHDAGAGDDAGPRLTAKQRRALERAAKPKYVGKRYYDTANVKNRNYNRKSS